MEVGTIEYIATINTSQYKKGANEIEKTNSDIEKSADGTSKRSNAAFNSIAKVGLAAIVTAAVTAAAAITKNIGKAIDRIDTLVAFPRVLQSLGATSEDAQKSTDELAKSLRGLPTSLQDGAAGVQQLVTAGLDVPTATKAFLGLNNALLVAGGGTAQAQSAMLQLTQALSRGKIEGQEWNTIAASMPTVMQALSKETGKTKEELREMFREDPQGLIDNIIRLNKEGGGGLASLDDQARQATGGIGTAFENMNNAITRGIEGIVRSIGDGGTDQEKLRSGQEKIASAITSVGNAFGAALGQVGTFIQFIARNKDIFSTLAVGIAAAITLITTWAAVTKAAAAAQAVFNVVMSANPILRIVTVVAALVAGLIYFFTQTKTGKKIWETFVSFLTKAWKSISKAFTTAWETIEGVWYGVTSFFQSLWDGVVGVFNSVVGFFKRWGVTILAVIFLPFAIAIGLIITHWSTIEAFFQNIWNGIVAVFTPVVAFFSAIFSAAWTAIKAVWDFAIWYYTTIWNGIVTIFSAVVGFFSGIFSAAWGSIVQIFSPIVSWFSDRFKLAVEAIKTVFGTLTGWFRSIWNSIVSIFSAVGTRVGDAIGNAFKSVINKVLSDAVNIINRFISAINWVIDTINAIPGVTIGKLSNLDVPQLADGGIVKARPGGILANIGEGGEDEAVLPLSKLDKILSQERADSTSGGSGITNNIQNITISSEVDGERWLRRLSGNQEIVSNGLVPAQSYM